MDPDLLIFHKGINILMFDLNKSNDDYNILQNQSMIKSWCTTNVKPILTNGNKCEPKIIIKGEKHINEEIEKQLNDEPDILIIFGGSELEYEHKASEYCDKIIQKRINGIEFIIYSIVKSNPDLVLDKFVCGFYNRTLILTLPLCTKESTEILKQIQKILKHALDVYHNDLENVRLKHRESNSKSEQSDGNLGTSDIKHSQLDDQLIKSKINLNVTQRARKSIYPMLDVETAQKLIMSYIDTNQIKSKQKLQCLNAAGYIVAESIMAKDDLPPFNASIKDGYAVISSDGAGKRKVIGEQSAGSLKSISPLKSHHCIRINTGAPIPNGADSVVQVEDTELLKSSSNEEIEIKILKTPMKGQDIRVKGVDIKQGSIILEEGNLIGSPELGLLASVGVTDVNVYKKPIIHILSTGNELQEPDTKILKPGCIRDSNRTMLSALLLENGFQSIDKGICKDEPDLLLRKLKTSLLESDVIITTGSVSMGDKDYLKDILIHDLNAKIHFGRINMKPGKPTTFATIGNKLIFCLPGNPVSAMVTCYLFVFVALKYISGYDNPFPCKLKCKIQFDLTLDLERCEYHRVSLHYNYNELLAYSTGYQLSSKLLSCKSCHGFVIAPIAKDKNHNKIEKNSLVEVILTKSLF